MKSQRKRSQARLSQSRSCGTHVGQRLPSFRHHFAVPAPIDAEHATPTQRHGLSRTQAVEAKITSHTHRTARQIAHPWIGLRLRSRRPQPHGQGPTPYPPAEVSQRDERAPQPGFACRWQQATDRDQSQGWRARRPPIAVEAPRQAPPWPRPGRCRPAGRSLAGRPNLARAPGLATTSTTLCDPMKPGSTPGRPKLRPMLG